MKFLMLMFLSALALAGESEPNYTGGTNNPPYGPNCDVHKCEYKNNTDQAECEAAFSFDASWYNLAGGECSQYYFDPGPCYHDENNCPYQGQDATCYYYCTTFYGTDGTTTIYQYYWIRQHLQPLCHECF